ncbi:MAG: SRPBCC domain-containing protein [Pseudomonadota bacterium]
MTHDQKITDIQGFDRIFRLQSQIVVERSIYSVWDALTRSDQVGQWWAEGQIGNAEGEVFQLGESAELSGVIVSRIKPYLFEFTWHENPEQAAHPEWIEPSTKGRVRFDLVQLGRERTLVTMIQLAPAAGAIGAAAGWHQLLEALQAFLEDHPSNPDVDRFEQLKKLYGA